MVRRWAYGIDKNCRISYYYSSNYTTTFIILILPSKWVEFSSALYFSFQKLHYHLIIFYQHFCALWNCQFQLAMFTCSKKSEIKFDQIFHHINIICTVWISLSIYNFKFNFKSLYYTASNFNSVSRFHCVQL